MRSIFHDKLTGEVREQHEGDIPCPVLEWGKVLITDAEWDVIKTKDYRVKDGAIDTTPIIPKRDLLISMIQNANSVKDIKDILLKMV